MINKMINKMIKKMINTSIKNYILKIIMNNGIYICKIDGTMIQNNKNQSIVNTARSIIKEKIDIIIEKLCLIKIK